MLTHKILLLPKMLIEKNTNTNTPSYTTNTDRFITSGCVKECDGIENSNQKATLFWNDNGWVMAPHTNTVLYKIGYCGL